MPPDSLHHLVLVTFEEYMGSGGPLRDIVLCLKANPEKPMVASGHLEFDRDKVTCPDCIEWMHA